MQPDSKFASRCASAGSFDPTNSEFVGNVQNGKTEISKM